MTNESSIEISQLTKIYRRAQVPAVNNISFKIPKGAVFGLLGPNGAGKTTTISVLCGLIKQWTGEITVEGLSLRNKLAEIKQLIGVAPQEIALYATLTAWENLECIGNMYGLNGKVLKERIANCLEEFGLEESAKKRIETFSGGMKRRINLIAAILHQPRILFLDEPTAGVDVQSRNVIAGYLMNLNKMGTTIIYTSHLMEEAESLCTDIAVIDNGNIIAEGKPGELISKSESANLEQLFLKLTGRKLRD